MSRLYLPVLIAFFCTLFYTSRLFGQQKSTDSLQLQQLSKNMIGAFNKAVGEQSRLYNGPADNPYTFRSATNPNFKDTTTFNNGTVNYDGIIYTNVPLIYNEEKDILVSHLYNGVSMYDLLSERVADFDLLDHHFIRLPADSLDKQITGGFYDELYNNKLQLLVKRIKLIEQESITRGVAKNFVPKNNYYLKKGAKYYDVDNQGKFLDVLKDKKKELKQYIKDNKLRFRDDPEHIMVVLAAYYDHLTN